MKKFIISLSILAMLGAIHPCLPTSAQPFRIPHENPETATGLPDEVRLLLSYSRIINLASDNQHYNAQDLLNELKHADIPENARLIIEQYNALWQQLFSILHNLNTLLDEASYLLDSNQTYELKQVLDNADADIQEARNLLHNIDDATRSLSDILGVFTATATNRLKQAHQNLEESIKQLDGFVEKLESYHEAFSEQYVLKEQLIHTDISISPDPKSAYIGNAVTVSGKLNGGGKPLTGKTVSVVADNQTLATAVTEPDGTYTVVIELPYIYKESMTVTALYTPIDKDVGYYLACKSPPATISTMFSQTGLEVSAPSKIYIGYPFTISGEVTPDNEHINRDVRVLINDTVLHEKSVSGRFSFEVMPTDEIPTGLGVLTIEVSPLEHYSAASVKRNINVSLLPVYINAIMPSFVLSPGDIEVSGRVYSEFGPVNDARINISLDDASVTTVPSSDGSFRGTIKTCLLPGDAPPATNIFYINAPPGNSTYDFSPVSIREITVTADTPQSPGSVLEVKKQVITVNPLSIFVILSVIAVLWLAAGRKSPILKRAETGATPALLPADGLLSGETPKLAGIKGKVISAYRSALGVVEKVTGVIMSPDTTLREFLKAIKLPSSAAADHFAELTGITESTLYSARSLKEDTATRAEELASNIREELCSGTP